MRCVIPSILVCAVLGGPALGQGLLYEIQGTTAAPLVRAAAAGDMTGDGIPDLLLSSGKSILIHSGSSGGRVRTLATLEADVTALCGGSDIDGDGVPDVLAAQQSLHRVDLLSGKSGFLMRRWSSLDVLEKFGTWVAFLDDLDSDGRRDVLLGARGTWDAWSQAKPGFLVACSTLTGNELGRFPADGSTEIVSVQAGGDLDGDLRQDVAVGLGFRFLQGVNWYYTPFAMSWTPSSLARRTLLSGTPTPAVGGDGYRVAIAGDLDRDQADDLVCFDNGWGRVVSGKSATFIRTFATAGTASVPIAVGDLDVDLIPDYAEATPAASKVRIFSGKAGTQLWEQVDHEGFGTIVFALGDVGGDRIPEIAIFAPQAPAGPGRLGVFTYRFTSWRAGYLTLLEPTGRSALPSSLLVGTGSPVVGGQLGIDIAASGYDVAVVLLGLGFQPGNVAPIPGNPLLLYLDERFLLPFTVPMALIGGRGGFSMPIPQSHSFFGIDLGLQAALFALGPPASYGASNLLIAKLGFSGAQGSTLYRVDLALRMGPGDNYKDALGQAARLIEHRGPAVFLTVLGSKAVGGPIELRTEPGAPPNGGGALLGTIGAAAGDFTARVQVPAGQTTPSGVYLLNRDTVPVDLKALHLRIE